MHLTTLGAENEREEEGGGGGGRKEAACALRAVAVIAIGKESPDETRNHTEPKCGNILPKQFKKVFERGSGLPCSTAAVVDHMHALIIRS